MLILNGAAFSLEKSLPCLPRKEVKGIEAEHNNHLKDHGISRVWTQKIYAAGFKYEQQRATNKLKKSGTNHVGLLYYYIYMYRFLCNYTSSWIYIYSYIYSYVYIVMHIYIVVFLKIYYIHRVMYVYITIYVDMYIDTTR